MSETPKDAARRLAGYALRNGYQPVGLHCYHDAEGKPVFYRIRCKHPDTGDKWIRPMRWDGSSYVLGEPTAPPEGKPLYRLPELLAADPASPIWIVEGEACVDALAKLGLVVTTSGAADSAGAADWTPMRGRSAIHWPDHDSAGTKYADDVADRLRALDCDVRRLDVAELNLPSKGDCVDWLREYPDATADDVLGLPVVQRAAETEAETEAGEPDAAEFHRLASLDAVAYERERKDAARRLGVRERVLDKLVSEARPREGDGEAAGRGLPMDDVEPWPHPIDPAAVLDDALALLARHVVAEPETLHAAALWVAMTWFTEHATVLPLAVITAPEKGCGKSTLLATMGRMGKRTLAASNVSPSALFRCVEAWQPTLLIDEADTFAKDNEELRGIINSGHTRETAQVIRAVEVNGEHEPRVFSTWGAKALAGIGRLPGTIESRAVLLVLRRAMPGERVANLRHSERAAFVTVQRKLARWADDAGRVFASLRPTLPALSNRAADNWEPLLALAEMAGGRWQNRAERAAVKLSGGDQEPTSNEELLTDIRTAFASRCVDRMPSEALLGALTADTDAPWATWNRGRPMTTRQLARRVREFGIVPGSIRLPNGKTPKGYHLDRFADAFARYLPDEGAQGDACTLAPGENAATTPHANNGAGFSRNTTSATEPAFPPHAASPTLAVADRNSVVADRVCESATLEPMLHKGCGVVAAVADFQGVGLHARAHDLPGEPPAWEREFEPEGWA